VAPKAKTKCARPRRAKAVSRSKKECQKAKVIEDLAVESSWKSDSRHLGKAQAGGAGAAKARKRRASAEAEAHPGPFGLDPCVEEVKARADVKAKRKGRKRKRAKCCAPNEGEEGKCEEGLEGLEDAKWTEGGDNQSCQGDDTAAWLSDAFRFHMKVHGSSRK
jgi:hypothetical protein